MLASTLPANDNLANPPSVALPTKPNVLHLPSSPIKPPVPPTPLKVDRVNSNIQFSKWLTISNLGVFYPWNVIYRHNHTFHTAIKVCSHQQFFLSGNSDSFPTFSLIFLHFLDFSPTPIKKFAPHLHNPKSKWRTISNRGYYGL